MLRARGALPAHLGRWWLPAASGEQGPLLRRPPCPAPPRVRAATSAGALQHPSAQGGPPPASLVDQGLAAIPNVRPSRGEAAAAWIKESMDTYFGQQVDRDYRSRSAWVLRQMDDKFSFLKPDTVVVDLGCFSGGWSQVSVERTHPSSSSSIVIGIDKVHMDPLTDHTFVQGDVADEETLERLMTTLGDRRADVVLSDLAPTLVGLKFEDHLASMQCCLYAARIMERTLRLGGWFIVKLQVGPEQGHWRTYLNSRFETVRSMKPPASRRNHREMFCVCRGFQGRRSIAEEVVMGPHLTRHEGKDRWDAEVRKP